MIEQLFDARAEDFPESEGYDDSPERKLARAVLIDAVRTVVFFPRGDQAALDRDWIFRDGDAALTFKAVCTVLDLDPEWIKGKIRQRMFHRPPKIFKKASADAGWTPLDDVPSDGHDWVAERYVRGRPLREFRRCRQCRATYEWIRTEGEPVVRYRAPGIPDRHYRLPDEATPHCTGPLSVAELRERLGGIGKATLSRWRHGEVAVPEWAKDFIR